MTKILWNKKWFKLAFIAGCLGVIVLMWGMDLFRLLKYADIPNEVRESANAQLVKLLSEGINPYRQLADESGTPYVFYMYPILNNAIAALVVRITHIQPSLVLLLLNFIYSLIIGFLIGRIIYLKTQREGLFFVGFIMMHYSCWRYSNVSAFPDTLALLLMIVICYIMTCKVRNNYDLNRIQIIISAVLTVLCFFTKQYAVSVGFAVVVFLIINRQWKALGLYIGTGIVIGGVLVVTVYYTMPYYFPETLLLVGNSADNDFKWLLLQAERLIEYFKVWILLVLIHLIVELRRPTNRLDLFRRYETVALFVLGLSLLYFGQNTGANMSYFFQLLLPYMILNGVYGFNDIIRFWEEKEYRFSIPVQFVLYLLLALIAVYPYKEYHTHMLNSEELDAWSQIKLYADDSENEMVSCFLGTYEMTKDYRILDYGQNEYILRNKAMEYWEQFDENSSIGRLFPNMTDIRDIHNSYREQILENLKNKEYDRLILVNNFGFTRDWEEINPVIEDNYESIDEIPLTIKPYSWTVNIWEPIR